MKRLIYRLYYAISAVSKCSRLNYIRILRRKISILNALNFKVIAYIPKIEKFLRRGGSRFGVQLFEFFVTCDCFYIFFGIIGMQEAFFGEQN